MPKGGARKGAGRKPRADVAAHEKLKLSLTADEFARVSARCPKGKTLAEWLREVLLKRARPAASKMVSGR